MTRVCDVPTVHVYDVDMTRTYTRVRGIRIRVLPTSIRVYVRVYYVDMTRTYTFITYASFTLRQG